MSGGWVVVVPVKGAIGAKTRLGTVLDSRDRQALALAFARDTITAASEAKGVEVVLVVTSERRLDDLSYAPRVRMVDEPPGRGGLNAAVVHGLALAHDAYPTCHRAVLLGDLPALRPAELATALETAGEQRLGYVADREGTGTTILTASVGQVLVPAFGPESAAAHSAAGHVELGLPQHWSIRRDVDTPQALVEAVQIGIGRHTARALDAVGREADADAFTPPRRRTPRRWLGG